MLRLLFFGFANCQKYSKTLECFPLFWLNYVKEDSLQTKIHIPNKLCVLPLFGYRYHYGLKTSPENDIIVLADELISTCKSHFHCLSLPMISRFNNFFIYLLLKMLISRNNATGAQLHLITGLPKRSLLLSHN